MENIEIIRKKLGISVKCLADLMNCDLSNLQKTEKGKRTLSNDSDIILSALKCHCFVDNSHRKTNVSFESQKLQKKRNSLSKRLNFLEVDCERKEALFQESINEYKIYQSLIDTEIALKIENFELKWRNAYVKLSKRSDEYQQAYVKYHTAKMEIHFIDYILIENQSTSI